MKLIFIILLVTIPCKLLFAYNLFETSFYDVEFVSDNIEDDKINSINKIKLRSIKKIFKQTLDKDNYYDINLNLSDDLINTFIKNIIINDEKIINNKYYSKIKINFNKDKIIDYYRVNKIPYVEYHPEKILLIIYEENSLSDNLFTANNNFYSYLIKNLSSNKIFKVPNLDINDRYILNKENIKNRNIKKINTFSQKYNLNDVAIVIKKINNNKVIYELILYSNGLQEEKIMEFENFKMEYFFEILENEILDRWKKINHIQNNSINLLTCEIDYFNLFELKEIRNNLNKISIIKNLKIKSLSYKNIEYDIFYYGNNKALTNIANLNKLKINYLNNSCTIKLR